MTQSIEGDIVLPGPRGWISTLVVPLQWLVFRRDGIITAAQYASLAATASAAGQAVRDHERETEP